MQYVSTQPLYTSGSLYAFFAAMINTRSITQESVVRVPRKKNHFAKPFYFKKKKKKGGKGDLKIYTPPPQLL